MKSFLSIKVKEGSIKKKNINRLHKPEKFLYFQEIKDQKHMTIQEKTFSIYIVDRSKLIRIIRAADRKGEKNMNRQHRE